MKNEMKNKQKNYIDDYQVINYWVFIPMNNGLNNFKIISNQNNSKQIIYMNKFQILLETEINILI